MISDWQTADAESQKAIGKTESQKLVEMLVKSICKERQCNEWANHIVGVGVDQERWGYYRLQ